MRAALLILLVSASWSSEAFGVWKLNPAPSTSAGNQNGARIQLVRRVIPGVLTLEISGQDENGRRSERRLVLEKH